jgi:alkylglycerol monooxygenase
MNPNPIILAIPVFLALILAELVYARIANKKMYRLNDAVSNLGCGITETVTGAFAKVFTVAAYHFVFTYYRVFDLPDSWLWFGIAFLMQDFFYYWAHRLSHEINLFWTGHVVHHQSEEYNLSVALRQGAMQKVYTFYFYLPMAFVGISTEIFILVSAINLMYQFWIHTKAIGKLGILEFVFNTPSHHRVHHGRNPKYIDKNHGGTLIIWDRMFGTFQVEQEEPVYGITTPLHTFNPVYATFLPLKNIVNDVLRIPGTSNKLKFLFKKPGWYPEELGGYQSPKEVEKATYKMFDIFIPPVLNYYLIIQFIVTLGGTAFYLFTYQNYPLDQQIIFTLLILFTIICHGILFDARSYAFIVELSRLFIVPSVVISYLTFNNITFFILLGIMLFSLFSAFYVIKIRRMMYMQKA